MRGREIVINDELYINAENDCVVLSCKTGNPELKLYTIEIPGRDGLLDLTSEIDGEVHYNNRQIEFRIFVAGEKLNERLDVLNNYHGQIVSFYSNYDNDFYYKGRLTVDVEERKSNYAYVVLNFDCEPFKIARSETVKVHVIRGKQNYKLNYLGKLTAGKIKLIQKGDEKDYKIALKIEKGNITTVLFEISDEFSFIIESGINEISLESGRIIDNNFTSDSSSASKITLSYTEIRI